jgi:hypothetical protein
MMSDAGAPQALDRQTSYTGTKEVAAPLRFDAEALDGYLRERVADYQGPLNVRQFRGGQSNPTYKLETPARAYVLRRKPPGKLLRSTASSASSVRYTPTTSRSRGPMFIAMTVA